MQVDKIHLLPSQLADQGFDVFHLEISTPQINHESPLGILGKIADLSVRYLLVLHEQLQQRLHGIKGTLGGIGFHLHLPGDIHLVAFLAQSIIVCIKGKYQIPVPGLSFKNRQLHPGKQFQLLFENHQIPLQHLIAGGIGHNSRGRC